MKSHDLDGLLAAVREEAWGKARERLAAELADHWVAEGRRRLGLAPAAGARIGGGEDPPGTAAEAAGRSAVSEGGDTPVWVYGVTPVGVGAPGLPGVGGAPAQVVAGTNLSVLVSALGAPLDLDDADAVAEAARAHDAVLRAAFAAGSVLPMRFGTVLRSADVDRLLDDAGLVAALSMVEGLAEWKVTLHRSEAESAPAAASSPGESGSEYLARKATVLGTGDPRAARAALDAALGPVVVARNGEHLLVRRDAEASLHAAASAVGERSGGAWEVSLAGPWPAFHFTDLAARS